MSGYSATNLIKKLGIKPDFSARIIDAPSLYLKETQLSSKNTRDLDFIHYFTTSKKDLSAQFPVLRDSLKPTGALWISWPKKPAKKDTDLDENVIREIGLTNGLVDVKVISIDEVWSGLKFVFRLKDREKRR